MFLSVVGVRVGVVRVGTAPLVPPPHDDMSREGVTGVWRSGAGPGKGAGPGRELAPTSRNPGRGRRGGGPGKDPPLDSMDPPRRDSRDMTWSPGFHST